MSQHADTEALSAFIDGEAPEWAVHVAGCGACGARADGLRAVHGALSTPVEPGPAGAREQAIATALGGASPSAPPARTAKKASRWLVPVSVAATLLVVVGALSLLAGSRRSDTTTFAGPSRESTPTSVGVTGDRSNSSAAANPTADLGDIADAATLVTRARAGVDTAKGSSSAATPQPQPAARPAPDVVGTRPCEEGARGREPGLRQLVYFATARYQGRAAVVLGFTTGPESSPVTLLVLAQDGCAELLRAVEH